MIDGCKYQNRKHVWEKYNPDVLDKTLWGSEDLRTGTPYCNEIGFRLIKQVASLLEEKYKQKLSDRAYEKILCMWALFFTGSLYTRYKAIKSATSSIENPVFITCSTEQLYPVWYNTSDSCMDYCYSDIFNLYIYSDLVKCMGLKEKIFPITLPSVGSLTSPEKKCSWKKQFLIKSLYLANRISGRPYHVITNSCAYALKDLVIKSQGRIIVDELNDWPNISVTVDEELRQQELVLSGDEFSQIVGKMAMRYIPWGLAEGMVEHVHAARKHDAKSAKSFFTSFAPWNNLPWVYTVALAQKPVGLITHGGNHSIAALEQGITLEKTFADVMFDSGPGANSLPNPRLYLGDLPEPQAVEPHVLFLGWPGTINSMRMGGNESSRVFFEYMKRRLEFFRLIKEDIPIILRRFYCTSLMENEEELLDVFPSLSFQNPQDIHFNQALSNAKLFISDYCWGSLTITESLTARKPSVLIWHKDFLPVTKRMEDVVAVLADAKIVHYNVETAAAHLNDVYSNPDAWWKEAKTQEALDFYIENFAIPIDGWQEKWISAIKAMG